MMFSVSMLAVSQFSINRSQCKKIAVCLISFKINCFSFHSKIYETDNLSQNSSSDEIFFSVDLQFHKTFRKFVGFQCKSDI